MPGGIIIECVKARRSVLLQTGAVEATGVCLCLCAGACVCLRDEASLPFNVSIKTA